MTRPHSYSTDRHMCVCNSRTFQHTPKCGVYTHALRRQGDGVSDKSSIAVRNTRWFTRMGFPASVSPSPSFTLPEPRDAAPYYAAIGISLVWFRRDQTVGGAQPSRMPRNSLKASSASAFVKMSAGMAVVGLKETAMMCRWYRSRT